VLYDVVCELYVLYNVLCELECGDVLCPELLLYGALEYITTWTCVDELEHITT
jgi:hypothetical protein